MTSLYHSITINLTTCIFLIFFCSSTWWLPTCHLLGAWTAFVVQITCVIVRPARQGSLAHTGQWLDVLSSDCIFWHGISSQYYLYCTWCYEFVSHPKIKFKFSLNSAQWSILVGSVFMPLPGLSTEGGVVGRSSKFWPRVDFGAYLNWLLKGLGIEATPASRCL